MIHDILFQPNTNIQILGLLLDIIGAFYIVRSFIVKNLKEMNIEAHGDIEGLPYDTLYSSYIQKREAEIGLFFLIPGFVLQAIGVLYKTDVPFVVVLIIILFGYFGAGLFFKKTTDKTSFKKAVGID